MADNLIDKLKELGFNSYEAKVYLALLKQSPATGYEISKESGVPQARAYDTLKALESNNIVVAMGGKPVTYTPISPTELLDRHERSVIGSISYLRQALPSYSNETVEPVINLRGDDAIFEHASQLIQSAKDTLFLQVWQKDAARLIPDIQSAYKRGVSLRVVGYDNCIIPDVPVFQHDFAQTIEKNNGLRWLFLSTDGQEGLIGTLPSDEDRPSQAIVTKNSGVVLLIKEFIGHDIIMLDVEKHFKPQLEEIYGKDFANFRYKVFGEKAPSSARYH